MKKLLLLASILITLPSSILHAQDLVGQWQGTLHAGKDLRIVMKIFKGDNGALKADFFSIDQGGQAMHASSFTRDGANLKLAINLIGGTYDGKLGADGKTISGTWTQGQPLPLDFTFATKEIAWEIPAPAPPPKLMAADANPSFDVATIKPNDSGATRMQGLTVNGRNFRTRNSSLADLIEFAYQVQSKQLIGAPDWIDKDRYDIDAVPDVEGAPNPAQVRMMIQKLLADRFQLKFHHDKKELSAFTLSVTKSGSKLTPTEIKGPLPGLGFGPGQGGISLRMRNGTIGDLTGFMQTLVLDRPVVDHTGLTDRYDLVVTFTPDDTQFNGHPPQMPKATDDAEPAPSLFEAFQQQLGLKLVAEKTQVDVVFIDHVDKPSAN